jgi:hypothetical protein
MAIVPEQPRDAAVTAVPPSASAVPATVTTPRPTPARRRLHPAVWRLVLMAVLFVGWMGYLLYLVRTRTLTPAGTPLVVSRSQVLVSDVDVVARVESLDHQVTVEKVLWLKNPGLPVRPEDKLTVTNLKDCHPLPRGQDEGSPPADFTGPGSYLLLLHRVGDAYQVVPVPYTPGYPPPANPPHEGQPRIYPDKPEVLAQYRSVQKPPREEEGEQ